MASMVVNLQKSLKNHQKKEAVFPLIKLMVPLSKKSKKPEFLLEGKNYSYHLHFIDPNMTLCDIF